MGERWLKYIRMKYMWVSKWRFSYWITICSSDNLGLIGSEIIRPKTSKLAFSGDDNSLGFRRINGPSSSMVIDWQVFSELM